MKEKVSIITGGAQGIGKEIALHFARSGSDICIADINYDLAKEAAEEIRRTGVRCIAMDVDTSDYNQVEQMVKKSVKEFGRLDVLVNNAAFVEKSPFLEYKKETWNKIIDVCLNGYFYCGQQVARAMVENGTKKGKIINLSSIAGFIPHGGLMAYTVAKAGVLAMTRVMAYELKKNDIAVNAVVPGITDTPLMTGVLGKMGQGKGPPLPKSAVSTAADVARVVLKVAQDDENLLTANHINVGAAAIGM